MHAQAVAHTRAFFVSHHSPPTIPNQHQQAQASLEAAERAQAEAEGTLKRLEGEALQAAAEEEMEGGGRRYVGMCYMR